MRAGRGTVIEYYCVVSISLALIIALNPLASILKKANPPHKYGTNRERQHGRMLRWVIPKVARVCQVDDECLQPLDGFRREQVAWFHYPRMTD